MKKLILITGILLSSSYAARSQEFSFNISGAVNSTNSMVEVLQPSTTANTAGIYVSHSGAITGTGYGLYSLKTGASTTNIASYFSASGATNNYALIVPSGGGNVGIGTTSPSELLHVTLTSDATKNTIYGYASQTSTTVDYHNVGVLGFAKGGSGTWGNVAGIMGIADQVNSYRAIGVYAGLGASIPDITTKDYDVALYSDGNSLGYSGIFMNGNVGIGTTAPSYKLHVNGLSTTAIYGQYDADAYGWVGGLNTGVYGRATGAYAAYTAGLYGYAANTGAGASHGVYGTGTTDGVYGISAGIGVSGNGGTYGVYGTITSTTANASGVMGYASAATGSINGVFGETPSSAGVGVYGLATNATGKGVWGIGNNVSAIGLSAGGGGMFNGSLIGCFGRMAVTTASGGAYSTPYIGVFGRSPASLRQTASADAYQFGVYGEKKQDFGGTNYYDKRSGGVLGLTYRDDNSTILCWGSLGYKSTGNVDYGGYGTVTTWTAGTGFMPAENIQTGIGSGWYGGIIGGWTRGEVMGHIAAGEMFASYNLGNEYTSGYSAEVVTLSDKRVAAYSVTSTEINVYSGKTSKLINGKARVDFERAFAELIGDNKPVITATPMGQCNGIYISNVDSKGFDVTELNSGNSNVEFSYIVISKRIDAENKPELPEALSRKDFDEKMKGVMFNENNLEQSATPIWWDGTKIRFEQVPREIEQNMKPSYPMKKLEEKEKEKENK